MASRTTDRSEPSPNLSGFSGNELCTLQLWFPLPLRTNFQGVPMRAEFKDVDKLVVHLEDAPENRRLTFVSGQDSKGNPLPRSTGSRVQQEFQLSPNVLQAGGFITATFAVHKNIPVEFFTQPKLTKPLGTSGGANPRRTSDSP